MIAEEGADVGGQIAGLAEAGEGVEAAGEQHGQHDQAQLGPPPGRGPGSAAHVVGGVVDRGGAFVVVVVLGFGGGLGFGGAGGRAAKSAACFSEIIDATN